MSDLVAVSWETWEPRHEATYQGAAHATNEEPSGRIPKYRGKTFCGKPIKTRNQVVEESVTCGSCLRSKKMKEYEKKERANRLFDYEPTGSKYDGEPDF